MIKDFFPNSIKCFVEFKVHLKDHDNDILEFLIFMLNLNFYRSLAQFNRNQVYLQKNTAGKCLISLAL